MASRWLKEGSPLVTFFILDESACLQQTFRSFTSFSCESSPLFLFPPVRLSFCDESSRP